MIHSFKNKSPVIAPTAFIVKSAEVIGDVVIGNESSVWFNSVIRGDINFIRIGHRTNIQDGCVLHVSRGKFPLIVGDGVTVGHNVTLHACKVKSRCLVGMGSVIMDGSDIGEDSLIGAGSLVIAGTVIPPRTLAVGAPAYVKRDLNSLEIESIRQSADHYVSDAKNYMDILKRK